MKIARAAAEELASAPLPSNFSQPINESFPFEYVSDLSEINRKRLATIEEARREIREAHGKFSKRLRRQTAVSYWNGGINAAVQCATVPVLGSSMIFPFMIPITLPLALGGLLTATLCDLISESVADKKTRYATIVTCSESTSSHLERLCRDIFIDGVVTQSEYELFMESYSNFKKKLLN
jgi:hypothetical protein